MVIKKEILEDLVDRDYTRREVANELGIGYSTVHHYMSRYNLKFKRTELQKQQENRKHKCLECGEANPKNFYGKRKKQCKKCFNKKCAELIREKRKRIIDERGGECESCGYNKYIGALDFHHPDPDEKDPNWNVTKNWTYERMKKQTDKCVLLCSNCHREEHARMRGLLD